jgi:FtsH-binding integral membrane protein
MLRDSLLYRWYIAFFGFVFCERRNTKSMGWLVTFAMLMAAINRLCVVVTTTPVDWLTTIPLAAFIITSLSIAALAALVPLQEGKATPYLRLGEHPG